MRIIANNFYYIEDPLLSVVSLRVGTRQVAVGGLINFFVDGASAGERLHLTTVSGVFDYEIVADGNELQQIYSLKVQPAGLVSNVATFTGDAAPVDDYDLPFDTATVLSDYDFWFSRQQFRLRVPNGETVDRIEEVYSEHLAGRGLEVTALQNATELVIVCEAIPQLNLTASASVQFRVFTNRGTYRTQTIAVVPGDPSLSECVVSGTFFEGDSTLSEAALQRQNMSIVLTLRFETWVESVEAIRSELKNIVGAQAFYTADPVHFESDRPPAANAIGLDTLVAEANVSRTSEQTVTITLGRNISIAHPETVSILRIPSALIRSGAANIPVIVPHAKVVLPSAGALDVVTQNGDVISEKDLWTAPTRVTLRAADDAWQDTSLLTAAAYQSFHDHVRSSMTSDSAEWTALIRTANFSLTTDGPDLFVDFAQQTSDDFNISSVIEVAIDVGATTASGLPTRLSGQPFDSTPFLLVKPVQSFVSLSKDLVAESELWSSDVEIEFRLTDDVFVAEADEVLASLAAQFDRTFPANQVAALSVSRFSGDAIALVIPQATPSTFNISVDTVLTFSFSSSFLRNGADVAAPGIHFVSKQVAVTVGGTDAITSQDLLQGFAITVDLINNSWRPSSSDPVSLICRSDGANGWNQTVAVAFALESESRMTINVQPSATYAISSIEVVDIYILKDATYNNKFHYAGNFTVQGSSLIERNHHDYNRNLQRLLAELESIKNRVHTVKLSLSPPPSVDDNHGDFAPDDTLYQRLMKLNSSDMEHPIAVCRPPLINGSESTAIQAALSDALNSLASHTVQRPFAAPLAVPVLCPSFDPASSGDTLYSILLSRPLPISLRRGDDATLHLPRAQVHCVAFFQADQSLTIFGDGVQTVSFHRASAP